MTVAGVVYLRIELCWRGTPEGPLAWYVECTESGGRNDARAVTPPGALAATGVVETF